MDWLWDPNWSTSFTNATCMSGCQFDGGILPLSQTGCYVAGAGNTIIGCTFQKRFEADQYSNPPRDTVGVYIAGTMYGVPGSQIPILSNNTTIMGIYLEGITTSFKLENCQNTNISGVNTMELSGYPSVNYINSWIYTLAIEYCNIVQKINQNVYNWNSSIWAYSGINETIGGNMLVRNNNNFANAGNEAVVNFGDSNHYIKAVNNSGVRIGTLGAADGITLLQTSGNVGIGTTVPGSKLEVNGIRGSGGYSGQIMVTGNNDHGYIQVKSTAPASKETGIQFIGNESINSPEWTVKIPAGSDDLRFNNKGSDKVSITAAGAVGIGNTAPASGLHIGASAGGNYKGYLTEEDVTQTPTLTVNGQMAICSKGNKICIAKRVSGTTRYTSIDMSANGNSWSTSTTTAP